MAWLKRGAFVVFALLALSVVNAPAQPGEGGGPGGGGGRGRGGPGMMAFRFVPVEQVLTFLAFDENAAVTGDQLAKVRDALKDIYKKRADLMKSLQGSDDRDAAMGEVQKLRGEMVQSLTKVLKAEQMDALKTHLEQMNQRGGGMRGGMRGDRSRNG